MTLLEKDIDNLLNEMLENQNLINYHSYITMKKNIIFANIKNIEIAERKEKILSQQKKKDKLIRKELELLDSFEIPFIGMKGLFIKSEYYGSIPRIYNDLDLLVSSDLAGPFYAKLKLYGYKIKPKTYYDNPLLSMKFFPKYYMENTQTLMLYNKEKDISIDLHSNLNITNAHFVNSVTKFSTEKLFENSKAYNHYNYIRQLEIHDHLGFVIRHLLKHHVFYGRTQTGLKTVLQHIMDFAVLVNTKEFSYDRFINKIIELNIVPETLFCVNMYNKIFTNNKKIDISPLYKIMNTKKINCHWKSILNSSLDMNITDLMIGNFSENFPKIYTSVEYCQKIKNFKLAWVLQALILNPIIIHYLSKN